VNEFPFTNTKSNRFLKLNLAMVPWISVTLARYSSSLLSFSLTMFRNCRETSMHVTEAAPRETCASGMVPVPLARHRIDFPETLTCRAMPPMQSAI
jgi:hypothetical protein